MVKQFEHEGIAFKYPENWALEMAVENEDGGWTVSVQSPETAFAVIALRPEVETPADLADQTLAVLKSEYKDLDFENVVETVARSAAIGHDIDFLTLDTAVSCRTRCIDTIAGVLLVMVQVSDFDRDRFDPVLAAICQSLTIEEP